MPLEASALIGSLGGIGAIAKEVFGSDDDPAPARRTQRSAAATPPGHRQTCKWLPVWR
jgi:hypothetical protein